MFLIKGLSQGIADEFREKRKLELKKISEAASNVTEARGKGMNLTINEMRSLYHILNNYLFLYLKQNNN